MLGAGTLYPDNNASSSASSSMRSPGSNAVCPNPHKSYNGVNNTWSNLFSLSQQCTLLPLLYDNLVLWDSHFELLVMDMMGLGVDRHFEMFMRDMEEQKKWGRSQRKSR